MFVTFWSRAVVIGLLLCTIVGCQSRPTLPTHAWDDFRDALRLIEQRNEQVANVTAAFDLTIRTPEGDTVTLEGAMVAERPNHLRLQAWRFHREVMDLTRRPDGTWLWTVEQADELEQQFAHPQAHEVDWVQAMFMTPDSETAELVVVGDEAVPMVVMWPLTDPAGRATGGIGVAGIDRATLTVRTIEMLDAAGELVQRLTFSEYRSHGGPVFPMRISAEGRFNATLRSHDVTLNDDLPADVFDPPAKANRLDD